MSKLIFHAITLAVIACCPAIPLAAHDSPVPIPSSEQGLKTIVAEPWFEVSPENHVLEGAIFDADGNLLFCDVTGRKVMRLTPGRKLSPIVELPQMSPGGLGLHRDGRIFIAAMRPELDRGAIFAFSPNDGKLSTIVPESAGYAPNDLVMDDKGGFYFSDFRGKADSPIGVIYYVTSDFQHIYPVISNLAQGNGVALSPDGKTLWAGEFAKNRLHMAELVDQIKVAPTGSYIPYYFTGPAPDSMRTDSEGNVYVAMYRQGRVLIFNRNGIPVAQALLPGRDEGKNLLTTSLAINPKNDDIFIVTSNTSATKGARIFRAKGDISGILPPNSKQ